MSELLSSKTGTIDFQGFHVIDLDELISLGADEDFAVYLHITNGGNYPQAFDKMVTGYNSSSTASPGESYYSFNGSSWTDLTTFDSTANFCVKAFAVPEPTTIVMLAMGLLALAAWTRRRHAVA